MSEVEVHLNERPDGFGFIYGEARKGDSVIRVNILPPAHLWSGDFPLDGYEPDPRVWQVFADGLIGRIARQEDVGAALVPLLTNQAGKAKA